MKGRREHNEGERGDGEEQVKRNMMRWTEIVVISVLVPLYVKLME